MTNFNLFDFTKIVIPNSRIPVSIDKWNFYVDKKWEWRWQRIAGNNRIVWKSTEGYTNKFNCRKNASLNWYKTLLNNIVTPIIQLNYYVDIVWEWRWQKVSGNNEIIWASSEWYKNHLDCKKNAER